jgi:N6-adenosine-specific RNA methylase IME4
VTLEAVTGQLDATQARRLTDEVKRDAAALWTKLLRLYEGGAHLALGYASWGDYFEAEFGGSGSRGYQLLDAGRVAGVLAGSTVVERPNEAQARELTVLLRNEGEHAVLDVYRELVDAHGAGRVTAELVREAVVRRLHREDVFAQPPPAPAVTPPFPDRRYRCIVVDPPWPLQFVIRYARPRQGRHLGYPTMSIDEIAALPVPRLADERGCHVYLWVVHRFLADGLRLLEHWGARYECALTWVKPGGVTAPPGSWMRNTEHVLFGRLGGWLPLERAGLKIGFDARRGRHSAKPDEFYERVTLASPEPRLDMFARQHRDGFDVWGNEAPA